jgi:hypothetical protein
MQERGGIGIFMTGHSHRGMFEFGLLFDPRDPTYNSQEMRQVQEKRQDDAQAIAFGWGHPSGSHWAVDASIADHHAPIDVWTGAAAGCCQQPPIASILMKEQQP